MSRHASDASQLSLAMSLFEIEHGGTSAEHAHKRKPAYSARTPHDKRIEAVATRGQSVPE